MNSRKIRQVINKAKKSQGFLRSDEYINAQLGKFAINQLVFKMGPNCNQRCVHCYGNYGPERKGLPEERIIRKTLEDATKFDIFDQMILTDGEPIRHENREVIRTIAEYSNKLPVSIMSNCAFARTQDNAGKWMDFLKNNGFDPAKKDNELVLSFGEVYDVHINNLHRINVAIKTVFPELAKSNIGDFLAYHYVIKDNWEEGNEKLVEVMGGINHYFGRAKTFKFNLTKDRTREVLVYPEKGNPVKISLIYCRPDGRARKFKVFDEYYPVKDLEINDLAFFPDMFSSLCVDHKGNVAFGDSGACVRNGRIYGNVLNENLWKIVDRIQKDEIYQAFNLGGARFMYYLGQQADPNFKIKGRTRCDPCQRFFVNSKLVRRARENLNKNGIAETYKKYINKLDFRKIGSL